MMKRKIVTSGGLLLLFATILTLSAGCSFVSVETRPYVGMPLHPPTDPATVEVLRTEPLRPHERLGEIAAEPARNPSVADIELKLRKAAAKIGANAVVLVADRTMRMGGLVTESWYSGQAMPEFKGVVVAVAIRYTDQ